MNKIILANDQELDLNVLRDLQELISTALALAHGITWAVQERLQKLRTLEEDGPDFARPTYLRGYLYRRIPKGGPDGKERREYIGEPSSPKALAALAGMDLGQRYNTEVALLRALLRQVAQACQPARQMLEAIKALQTIDAGAPAIATPKES